MKMDVEGAEYRVIKEVASTNVLCDLVKMGARVILMVEWHTIPDEGEAQKELPGTEEAKDKLMECGVEIQELPAINWVG